MQVSRPFFNRKTRKRKQLTTFVSYLPNRKLSTLGLSTVVIMLPPPTGQHWEEQLKDATLLEY